MVYLAAAVILVGLVGLLNLILLIALVRRLRVIEARPVSGSDGQLPGLLAEGSRAPAFAAMTTAGDQLELGGPAESMRLVAFFSGTCAPCRDHLPAFVQLAATAAGSGHRAVVVLRGADDTVADLLDLVDGPVEVIREAEDGPAGEIFSVQTYPSMYLIDNSGTIRSAAHIARQLRVPVAR